MEIDEFSEPQPDLALLKPRSDFYVDCHPVPEDVLLVMEISHTTADYDAKIKGPLYAEAGISEYWQVDVQKKVVIVGTNAAEGEYRKLEVFQRGQTITLTRLPSISFSVEDIFG